MQGSRLLACRKLAALTLLIGAGTVHAQPATPARTPLAEPVVVSGTVPDEATRQAILARVRSLYGAERVIDQLGVGALVAPPNWSKHIDEVLHTDLRQVHRGQLTVEGNDVELLGDIANEAQRQQVVSAMAQRLNNPTYVIRNGLQVSSAAQDQLDAALAKRTIEFESGAARLTSAGQAALDELMPVLSRHASRQMQVIGHTDASGDRQSNIVLSQARADAVRDYLVARGVASARIDALGAGPDRPVADNTTPEGRARNRRIELRLAN